MLLVRPTSEVLFHHGNNGIFDAITMVKHCCGLLQRGLGKKSEPEYLSKRQLYTKCSVDTRKLVAKMGLSPKGNR